jgi:small conductance mechanosensitive channel
LDPDFRNDIIKDHESFGFVKFADSALIVKARVKTKPIKQWAVAREFNRRLNHKFDEQGIEIPFPHLTMYMGENKQHSAPPLNLTVSDYSMIQNQ